MNYATRRNVCTPMSRSFVLLVTLLAACAERPASPGSDPPAVKPQTAAHCGLTISFGSYAMGIDSATLAAIEAVLGSDRSVSSVEHRRWGREGEVTLCVRVARDADIVRLHRGIAAMLPADPRGPIEVRTRGGVVARAPRS